MIKKTILSTTIFALTACSSKIINNSAVSAACYSNIPAKSYIDQNFKNEHNTKSALDWAGIYEGVIPCASCEGIKIRLTINQDNTFTVTETYLKGKDSYSSPLIYGSFLWHKNGSIIYLLPKNKALNYVYFHTYFIGENHAEVYDLQGKEIKSELNYRLKQIKKF